MSIEFKLPAVGENIDKKREIGGLRVAVGDTIAADQIVMEIETDKAVFELPCPHAGKVTKIHVKPGQSVKTGAPLLTIDESGAAAEQKPAPAAATEKKTEGAAEKQAADAPSEAKKAGAAAVSPKAPAPAHKAPATANNTAQESKSDGERSGHRQNHFSNSPPNRRASWEAHPTAMAMKRRPRLVPRHGDWPESWVSIFIRSMGPGPAGGLRRKMSRRMFADVWLLPRLGLPWSLPPPVAAPYLPFPTSRCLARSSGSR